MATTNTKTQPQPRTRRPSMLNDTMGLVSNTLNVSLGTVNSGLNTVGTLASTVEKGVQIIDIKLDEIKLESWADLQETRVETFQRLLALGMSEEDVRASFDAHGFK